MEGIKHDQGKLRWGLVPKKTVQEVIKVLMFGADKYDDYNWKKVSNRRTRYYEAAQRHLTDEWWENSSMKDKESGFHPLAHVVCCCLFLIWCDLFQKKDKDGNYLEEEK